MMVLTSLARSCLWLPVRVRARLSIVAFVGAGLWSAALHDALAAGLREFASREINVSVLLSDGKPVVGASVYGFCSDLNLVWPRGDEELVGSNDARRYDAFLGKTGPTGRVKAILPPGKWGFFAAGKTADERGPIVAAWSDFTERTAGQTVTLVPARTKRWSFCTPEGVTLAPDRLYLKPEDFPIWIPLNLGAPANSLRLEVSAGPLQIVTTRNATVGARGFVLDWGVLNEQIPDGQMRVRNPPAVIECKGGQGRADLSWFRNDNFGLEGELTLADGAQVMMSPGSYILSYRRPLADKYQGDFVGQLYELQVNDRIKWDFTSPLEAAVDQQLDALVKGHGTLYARFYLVDSNKHVLALLSEQSGRAIDLGAAVIVDGKRFSAKNVWGANRVRSDGDGSQTSFEADVGDLANADAAIWSLSAPPGVLSDAKVSAEPGVLVATDSFQMQVPKLIERHAKSVLWQAETLGKTMDRVSGAKRSDMIVIRVKPGRSGSTPAHDGKGINLGAKLLFSETPMTRQDFVHELAHNFGLKHSGLMETIVEASRCGSGPQLTNQGGKWTFLDRMNGLKRKDLLAPNAALYLYCYALAGPSFLSFMLEHEVPTFEKLSGSGFTEDEFRAALLGLALGRDITPVCAAYGMTVKPERVALATTAVRTLRKLPAPNSQEAAEKEKQQQEEANSRSPF